MKLIMTLFGIIAFSVSAQMPGFDMFVGDLKLQEHLLEVQNLKALTNRNGYDNQPLFLADGQSLLFTSAVTKNDIEQTDSMLMSLKTNKLVNLTNSTESEYSPTEMPFGNSFSVIRAVGDKQKLWRYPLNPTSSTAIPASELLTDINPVGYHAWIDNKQVILFVLGEPHSLQLANINTQTSKVLDKNIGPSLFAIPNSSLMSYTAATGKGDDIKWQLKSYDPTTAEISVLTHLPEGAYYYAWTENGFAIAAVESTLLQWDMANSAKGWQPFADVSEQCSKGVTRLASNRQNSKIAVVCTL